MRVAIAGASGFIGEALVESLKSQNHEIRRLVRRPPHNEDEIYWKPSKSELDPTTLSGISAVVCLSGENIGQGRWTSKKKTAILNSRVESVSLLARTLSKLDSPPNTLICASAVGYYGSQRGEEILTEESEAGDDFLADVCKAWEWAAQPALQNGIRVVQLRFGAVLDKNGGMLAQLLPVFRLGLGGVLGNGTQYFSWIARDDAVNILRYVLENPVVNGPINATSPSPVTNREFTKTLGSVLSRPTVLPVPRFAIRAVFGEMGDTLLLGSTRAVPKALGELGYSFSYPELKPALAHAIA